MNELIIGAFLGVLSIISVAGILVSIWLISQQRRLFEELDDLQEEAREGAQEFRASVQVSFGMLENAMKALADKHGLAWDADAGEWRKVQ